MGKMNQNNWYSNSSKISEYEFSEILNVVIFIHTAKKFLGWTQVLVMGISDQVNSWELFAWKHVENVKQR